MSVLGCSAATEADLQAIACQLGRPVRNLLGVAHRLKATGEPTVVVTAPRLDAGTPFPTLYYLTHPKLTAAVSQLEAVGRMQHYQQLLSQDADLASKYLSAHELYLQQRKSLGDVAEIDGISAGGMPTRVKCLHALVAHSLAAGSGVNPIGDMAIAELPDDLRSLL